MGIVVSCANLATIYHNTKYSGGKVVNYLHISRKCSGCVRDALGKSSASNHLQNHEFFSMPQIRNSALQRPSCV